MVVAGRRLGEQCQQVPDAPIGLPKLSVSACAAGMLGPVRYLDPSRKVSRSPVTVTFAVLAATFAGQVATAAGAVDDVTAIVYGVSIFGALLVSIPFLNDRLCFTSHDELPIANRADSLPRPGLRSTRRGGPAES